MPTPETIELPSHRYAVECMQDRAPRGGSHVYGPTRHFPVTNLGWLLRHAVEVHDFYVRTRACGWPWNAMDSDAMLGARLEGGRVYVSPFADRTVLHGWLNRPRFRGLRVSWDFRTLIIGSDDYRALGFKL